MKKEKKEQKKGGKREGGKEGGKKRRRTLESLGSRVEIWVEFKER